MKNQNDKFCCTGTRSTAYCTSQRNKEHFRRGLSQDNIFSGEIVSVKVEKGVNLQWEVRHLEEKKKKGKEKPEASTTFSVFMGLGIYEAVWMFSGMSGLCWTPVLGCVPAGATRPAVKGIVKEIPAFGSWEA